MVQEVAAGTFFDRAHETHIEPNGALGPSGPKGPNVAPNGP